MDYRALEQDLVLEVKISKDQSITLANPVTFRITPLTIDKARVELGIDFTIDPETDNVSPVRAGNEIISHFLRSAVVAGLLFLYFKGLSL